MKAGTFRVAVVVMALGGLLLAGLPATAAEPTPTVDRTVQDSFDRDGYRSSLRTSASETSRFQQVGCWNDPVGDTLNWENDRTPEEFDRADLTEHCADYAEDLVLAATVVEPTDPRTDSNWISNFSFIDWDLDTTLDAELDLFVRYQREGDSLVAQVLDYPSFAVLCDASAGYTDGVYFVVVAPDCIGSPDAVGISVFFRYDSDPTDPTAPTYVDFAPNDAAFDGPLARTDDEEEEEEEEEEEFDCSTTTLLEDPRPDEVDIFRVNAGTGTTRPITQAVAASQSIWCNQSAGWVILSRDDVFADALAGSGLAFGGPVLFTWSPVSAPAGQSPGELAPQTRAEIQRVLPEGGAVYVLGGEAALDRGLDAELTTLGYRAVRMEGGAREDTAAVVADEVRRLYKLFSVIDPQAFPDVNSVLVATRSNWVDAVTSGALASFFGIPVLLTSKDTLHPATEAAIVRLRPGRVYVAGGTAVISEEVRQQAADVIRAVRQDLAGETRTETTIEIGREMRRLIDIVLRGEGVRPEEVRPSIAIATNLSREPDGWTHILSAASIGGQRASVYLPVLDQNGQGRRITDTTVEFVCNILAKDYPSTAIDVAVAGDIDLLAASVDGDYRRLMILQNC